MIFVFLFLFISYHAYIAVRTNKPWRGKSVVVFAFIFAFFVSFLRWDFGPDFESYVNIFNRIDKDNDEDYERLFVAINVIANKLFGHYTFALLGFSLILYYCKTKTIMDYSVFPLISLMVFSGVYNCDILYVRQIVAVSLLFYSVRFIIKDKFWLYLVTVYLAFEFHHSAAAFLPAWWLYRINLSRKQIIFCTALSLLAYVVLLKLLESLGAVLGGAIEMRINMYVEAGQETDSGESLSYTQQIAKALMNRGVIFAAGCYLLDKVKDIRYKGLFNLYCFGNIIFFLFSPISLVLGRLSWSYDVFQILIIPYMFVCNDLRKHRSLLFLMLFLYLGLKVYLNTFRAYEDVNTSVFHLTPLFDL